MRTLFDNEALDALNELRSNIVATQNAGWSNLVYPLVTILNATEREQFTPSPEQLGQHFNAYGGAGGYPGHLQGDPHWAPPYSELEHLKNRVRIYLSNPCEDNRKIVEHLVKK